MENLKVSSMNNHYAIEDSSQAIAPTIEHDNEKNGNYFLIGLNFQGGVETGGDNRLDQKKSKIPVFMLKIDADKLLSDMNSRQNQENEESDWEYTENNNLRNSSPVSGIYTYRYEAENSQPLHESLSYREMQVLKLIALGKTRKEIADELFLSISTINTYRARILEKMDMKNNADLMRYAFKQKLVD